MHRERGRDPNARFAIGSVFPLIIAREISFVNNNLSKNDNIFNCRMRIRIILNMGGKKRKFVSSSFSKKSVLARVKEEEQEGKRKAILFILLPQGANRVFAIGKGGFGGQRADFSAQGRHFGGQRADFSAQGRSFGGRRADFSAQGRNFGWRRADFSAQERRFGGKRKEKRYKNHEDGCKKVVKMRKKS